ncbi:MAG TPA: SDR family oxidoreductase [Anaerolineales bacterium]
MKLTIFGATGAAGRQLIQQALAEGYDATAFVRNPSRLTICHENLTVIQGELYDVEKIEHAVNSADAIISLLGPRPGEDSKGKPLTQGTRNIIVAMKKFGIRRLIVVCTPSASAPSDLPDLKFKLLVSMIKTTMRPVYEEIVNVAQVVRDSDLDWTIVRVSILNNNSKFSKVRVGYLGMGEVGVRISRADMAGFILDELKNAKYISQMPAISN